MSVVRRLTARRLITDVGVVEYPVVTVGEDGRIAEIESDVSVRSEEVLSAALLDVHTHGAAGHDVMEATPEAMGAVGRFFARHGVGGYLPTTVTAPVDVLLRSLEGLAGFVERGLVEGQATPLGVHLEGPFLSHGKRGVHPAGELQRPDVGLFRRMWEASQGTIRLMTVAPELPGAEEMIAAAVGAGGAGFDGAHGGDGGGGAGGDRCRGDGGDAHVQCDAGAGSSGAGGAGGGAR